MAVGAFAAATPTTSSVTTSVTSLFLPGFDQQTLVASVITAAPSATQYVVNCAAAAPSDCGVGKGMTLLEGPFTFSFNVGDTGSTMSEACVISSDVASCTYSIGGSEADGGPTTGSQTNTGIKQMYLPVTITAGAQKLAGVTPISMFPSTATPTPTPTSTSTSTATADGASVTVDSVGAASSSDKKSAAVRTRWSLGAVGVGVGVAAIVGHGVSVLGGLMVNV